MAALHLQLLGGFEARLGRKALRLPKKVQALLAYLTLAAESPVSRTQLAALLWSERDEDDARNSLRQALFQLRRALGPAVPALALHGDTVSMPQAMIETDVRRFERLAAGAGQAALQQAADLYRGDLLSGLDIGEAAFEEWLWGQRARLRERGLAVLSRLLERQLARGSVEAAVGTALRLLSVDPLQEGAHRALMRAYAATGRRAAALRQYQLCVEALQREVQAEPEPATRRLYVEILRQAAPAGAPPERRPAVRARRSPQQGPPPFAAPLVGRDVEMGRLRQAVADAAAGKARLAIVLGEAGVGKSRTVQELVAEVAGTGWLVLEGRGHETEQGLPLAPWVAAFRAAGIVEDDTLIARLAPAWRGALAPLFPELSVAGRGRPGERTENQRRLFEALSHLLSTLAVRHPLFVLMEDLHWADTASLLCLAYLARRLEGVRACVVGTARLDEGEAGSLALRSVLTELGSEGLLTEVLLSPLSRPEVLQLIEALTFRRDRRLSPEQVERIWTISEGNPFVVVEALRSFDGASARDAGAALALPEGVRRLTLDRVERLSQRARETVAAASVVGRDFDYALVRQVTGLGDDDAAAAFEELVRRHLLQQRASGFDFTHDRVREAVLDSLLPPRRRLLHAAVARALETVHAGGLEAHAAALAHHCREGQLWSEAVDYLRQASAVATARGSFRDAVSLLEQALDLLPKLAPGRPTIERACDVRLGLGDRTIVLGEFARAEHALLEALALATELGDERRAALARARLAQRDAFVRRVDRGLGLAEQALAAAERLGDSTLEARAALAIGAIWATRGEHATAIAAFQRVLRAAGDDPLTAETAGLGLCHVGGRAWMAQSLAELGRFDEALALVREAVARADAARHVFSMARTRLALGRIYLLRGDLEPAIASLVASHDLIKTYEIGFLQRACAVTLASARVQAGSASTADFTWPGPRTSPVLLLAQGEALLAEDRPDEALTVADEALVVARGGERGSEAWALALLGAIHARSSGTEQRARDAYAQALAIAAALGLRPLEAHGRRGLGQLLARTGEIDSAREHLAAALTLYREMGMTRWVAATRAELDAA